MMVHLALLLFLLAGVAASAQPLPDPGPRDAALVAVTPGFRFYSDFWLNLHDYLYGLVGGGPGEARLEAEATACIDTLPADQAAAWASAVTHYEAGMAERHHRRDPLMRTVRYRMAELDGGRTAGSEMDRLMAVLREAAPAYRACVWAAHDARNRRRIEELATLVERHGPALTDRLGTLYRSAWPDGVTVDVTSYASATGANTASGPDVPPHVMVSHRDPDLAGYSGLELLFHEASHVVFGPNHGRVTEALTAAAESLGVEMPRALWHAVSFHTSGWAVQREAASRGVAYGPYWRRNKVFAPYHDAVQTHWQPYLGGTATMDAAALALVRAVTASPAAGPSVLAIDFVRTFPGEQADYLRFIELNWAAARAAAREEGAVVGYDVILREPQGDDWDVMLITEYASEEAYARREEVFAALFERPELAMRPVGGKGPRDMATFVASGVEARRVLQNGR